MVLSSVWLKHALSSSAFPCAFSNCSNFFLLLDSFTHSLDAQHMVTCPAMTVSNLIYVVLVFQFKNWPCLRQKLKMWMPNPHLGILNCWDGLCDSNLTWDETPAFFLWWQTTGLVKSLDYAMTTNSILNRNKWFKEKMWYDLILFKNNREVALTLACIISKVKTMRLTCKLLSFLCTKLNILETTTLLFC